MGNQRWVSILVLMAFISGCTSPRVPIQSLINGVLVGEASEERVLAVGDDVVVVLLNGNEEKGKVLEISSDSMVLGHTGNYGYNETRIETTSIDRIELVTIGVNWPVLVVGVVVVGVGLVVGFAHGMSQLR